MGSGCRRRRCTDVVRRGASAAARSPPRRDLFPSAPLRAVLQMRSRWGLLCFFPLILFYRFLFFTTTEYELSASAFNDKPRGEVATRPRAESNYELGGVYAAQFAGTAQYCLLAAGLRRVWRAVVYLRPRRDPVAVRCVRVLRPERLRARVCPRDATLAHTPASGTCPFQWAAGSAVC